MFTESISARIARGRQTLRRDASLHSDFRCLGRWAGARVTEIPVAHHPRTMGHSKYGLSRTIKVIFDLITIKFMASYQTKPLYLFGWAGLLTFGVSLLSALLACLMKFADWPHHADFIQTPLPVMAMVMLVLGIQLFLMGLLAEMLVRTYHESQEKRIYAVRERIGFDDE